MRIGRLAMLMAILLGACSSSAAPARPTWPEPRPRPVDGGESLAPRAAARAIAAVIEDDKPADKPVDKPATPAAPAAVPESSSAAAKPAAPPPPSDPDEPATGEEIVIEIED